MFSPTQRAERRGLRLELEVRGKDADGRSFKDQAQSRNVSGGGICFASRRLLALGTRLELRIALPPPLRRPFGNRPIYAGRASASAPVSSPRSGYNRELSSLSPVIFQGNAPSTERTRRQLEVNTPFDDEDDKPWKTDLARKSAQRRIQVLQEIEEQIKKAPSFEEALRLAVELMKKKFARFSAVTAYVADGEDLAVHIALDRPQGPDRVWSGGGPLAEAAQGSQPAVVSDLTGDAGWTAVGLTKGSAVVAPIRTEAGLWAIVEVWSDFRDAFTVQDVKLIGSVVAAVAKKTPAA
jgi:putative methionine-R-sulfoxide reductase with GAF domain